MSKYIKVDDLQAYCDNQIDHSITPNVFQRMNHYEFPETDFECLKRIFTKAKLVTAFDEYEGMFDNKIIVFLNGNELHLWFDKNTGEVQEVNNDALSEEHMEKKYEIESDCAFDREYGKYVPTIYLCGCCHAKVNKTDTMCWHCRSKLYSKDLESDH